MLNLPRQKLAHGNISLFSFERMNLVRPCSSHLVSYLGCVVLTQGNLFLNISLQWSGIWVVFTEVFSLQGNIFCFLLMSAVHWLRPLHNVHSRQIFTWTGINRICFLCLDHQTLSVASFLATENFTILQFVVPKFQLETKSTIFQISTG